MRLSDGSAAAAKIQQCTGTHLRSASPLDMAGPFWQLLLNHVKRQGSACVHKTVVTALYDQRVCGGAPNFAAAC